MLRIWMAWVVTGSLAAGVMGCGGHVTTDTGGSGGQSTTGTGGSGGAGNGGTAGNGGVAGDGGTAGNGGVAGSGGVAGAGGIGSVGIARLVDFDLDVAIAQFSTNEGPNCTNTVQQVAGCQLYVQSGSCAQTFHDGGMVTIESPVSLTTLTLDMPTEQSASPLFQTGDVVQMSSTGAEVPAFAGSVVAPPLIQIASPSFGSPLDVMISQGITVTWPPAAAGQVVVFVSTSGGSEDQRTASCTFDAAAGTGKIPGEVLAAYGEPTGDLYVYSVQSTTVMAGSWPVYLFVEIQSIDSQGNPAQVPINLQ